MPKLFAELKDELFQQKARLNFILKAFGALATAASKEESNDWEAFQAVAMAREILDRIVQRTEEALEQHLHQTEEETLEQCLQQIDKEISEQDLCQADEETLEQDLDQTD